MSWGEWGGGKCSVAAGGEGVSPGVRAADEAGGRARRSGVDAHIAPMQARRGDVAEKDEVGTPPPGRRS